MSIFLRALLLLLLGLRLLMPPGICVCHQSAPAARLLADLLGTDEPAEEEDNDHDHHPGCPASCLSAGLGLKPLPGPGPLEWPLTGRAVPASETPPAGPADPSSAAGEPAPPPSRASLQAMLCAYLI